MLIVFIDVLERLIKYLKPFAAKGERVSSASSTQPIAPPAPAAAPAEASAAAPDPGLLRPQLESLLAGRWNDPTAALQTENRDAELANFLADADKRNNGPRKLGSIYRLDRDTPVYPKLRYNSIIWNQIFLKFSQDYSISWDET